MVRYTLAVAGPPRNANAAMHVEEKLVDIFTGEQLEEHFLQKINHKGLVPVLTNPTFEQSLPDSLDITFYIAERYPRLSPDGFQETIKKLLFELHSLNYFSLSFGTRPQQADQLLSDVDDRLKGDISDRYRKALEFKRQYTLENKWNGVQAHEIEENEAKATALVKKFDRLLPPTKTWLFGLGHPTALDAHLVIFIARMKDVGRANILTSGLLEYHGSASKTEEFKNVMGGRVTMIKA